MNTQSLILAILNFGDATGYEIKKQSTEGAFSFFVDISYGTIYPTLARLEADGMVASRAESQTGKPDKKIYTLTDHGREEFSRLVNTIPQKDKFKSEFLLVAMCADICNPALIEQAIEKQMQEMQEVLDIVDEMDAHCEHAATRWVTAYGRHMKQASMKYLRENKDALMAISHTHSTQTEAAE